MLQKLSAKLIAHFESKLKNCSVFFSAKRLISSKWVKVHKSQIRPRNRSLTAVHDALLEDLFHPANIIGRRTRVRVDGSKIFKVIVDINDKESLESKLKIAAEIYRLLTNKTLSLEFAADF